MKLDINVVAWCASYAFTRGMALRDDTMRQWKCLENNAAKRLIFPYIFRIVDVFVLRHFFFYYASFMCFFYLNFLDSQYHFSEFEDDELFSFSGIQFLLKNMVFAPGFFCQFEVCILDTLQVSSYSK